MGRTDDIQEGDVSTQQQQQFAPGEPLKQPAEEEGPPAKMPRVEATEGEVAGEQTTAAQTEQLGVGGTGDAAAFAAEAEKPVTRLADETMNLQESLESMRESNAPHTGEEIYDEAVRPEAAQPSERQDEQPQRTGSADATAPDSTEAARETSETKEELHRPVTRLDDGTIDVKESLESMRESNAPHTGEELYKDAVHPEAPQHEHHEKHPSDKAQGPTDSSPQASKEEPHRPVTRLDDGTLSMEESLESMRESNTPHTGEQLYEDAVPAAEGTVKKTKGRGGKRSRRQR